MSNIELNELKESQNLVETSNLNIERKTSNYKLYFTNFVKYAFNLNKFIYPFDTDIYPFVVTKNDGIKANGKFIESIINFLKPIYFKIKSIKTDFLGFLFTTDKGAGLLDVKIELLPVEILDRGKVSYLIKETGKYLFILGSDDKIKFIIDFLKKGEVINYSIGNDVRIFNTSIFVNYLNAKDSLIYDYFTNSHNLLTLLGPEQGNNLENMPVNYIVIKHLGA